MANSFFKNGDKAYSENLNDSILVGNAFDWTVDVSLPSDTDGVFPNSSTIVKAKVADVSITPNSNLSIGSSIENSSGSSQVYRLTVYPNFNRFGGFKSIALDGDGTFYIANKGDNAPIANNLDYDDLSNVPELKVLKEYDIVVTIPNNGEVTGLGFVFQSSSANVSGTINQSNVDGLNNQLDRKVDKRVKITASSTDPVDLNDYTNAGFYYNNSNITCAYISNLPEPDNAFYLLVEDWGESNYTKQTITHYSTGNTYTRVRIKGTWKGWKQLLDYDNLENTSSNIKMNGTASVGSLGTVARADHIHPSDTSKVNVGSIVDNLTSTATNVPLSAKQGKVLNDTKLNTSNLFNLVYPVGSIYMSVNSTSPQTLFGGTWEKIKDTFLLSSGDTYTSGTTGGSADATLVSHRHGTSESNEYFVTSEMENANNTTVSYNSSGNRLVDGQLNTQSSFHHRVVTGYAGESGTGKNMPPYLVVNVWKRTA